VQLGVDIGGTHTDAIIVDDAGAMWRGKALTTYEDFSAGIMASVGHIAEQMDRSQAEVLSGLTRFVNGTTVATNVVAQLRGARVGLIATKGFEHTLFLARMPRGKTLDLHQQRPLPEIVPQQLIRGVAGRIDKAGQEVVPVNIDEVREAARYLVEDENVEEIVISLLWSFVNPAHERAVAAAVKEVAPDVPVTVSSELIPVIREYERTVTSVLNGYVGPATRTYLDTIQRRTEAELNAQPSIMTSTGGFSSFDEARSHPVFLMTSGPSAGVMGAKYLGELLGESNVVVADVGGTSFDVAALPNLVEPMVHRIKIGEFSTAMSAINVDSIGAGGGSIAWVDSRGILNVGPASAGSEPGPACYDRGGTEPTVTDALVTLGLIRAGRYLGGRVGIHLELAEQAIRTKVCDVVGGEVSERAADIVRLALTTMTGRLALSTVEKGHDPADFTMFAYGGLGPMLCPVIAQEAGIKKVVVPQAAAQFSALGLLSADRRLELTRTKQWILPDGPEEVNETFAELIGRGRQSLIDEGFEGEIEVQKAGDFSFLGQHSEFAMPLPIEDLDDQSAAALAERFETYYEELHGPGTAWKGIPVQMVNYRARITGRVERPALKVHEPGTGTSAEDALQETIRAYPVGHAALTDMNVYDWGLLQPSAEVDGPAIVAADDTTVYVPVGFSARMDPYRNLVLTASS
jgi:N-methylhydantoinase A